MFRQFASTVPGGAELLFRLHPVELSGLLEQAWAFRVRDAAQPLGHPDRRSDLPGLPEYLLSSFETFKANQRTFRATRSSDDDCGDGCVRWPHLIYAYMVENTRVVEVFRRVLHAFRHGEDVGVPLEGSEHWLRATEELFFRDAGPYFINSHVSEIRPAPGATRRNAYWRMFGMDLNHGNADGQPVSFVKPSAANTQFVSTFEDFLREVWLGVVNFNNTSGQKFTDDSKIANLAEKLHDMLRTRRLGGNLAREEFEFVSMMSWFHLTLEHDFLIIKSLRAEGASPEERLKKAAERMKFPAHGLAKSFFDMADAASELLIFIETGIYNDVTRVRELYDDASPVQGLALTVITHWSIATGRDLKARRVESS